MNNAARPRNDTTKLNALATGLRLMTTAAPKITVSNAKIQNRNGDISLGFEFRIPDFEFVGSFLSFHFSATRCITADRCVILNEGKDLAIEALANEWRKRDPSTRCEIPRFARDDGIHFFSFHFSTTPCITPPISRSFSL
jgi:hypothetical protein